MNETLGAALDHRTGTGFSVSHAPLTLAHLRILVDNTQHWPADSLIEIGTSRTESSIYIHRGA